MAEQILRARENGVVFDIGAERPGGGYAVAALDEDVLDKLGEVLTELQGKLEEGQSVALSQATLDALETVNANITEPLTVGGTVELGATSLSALETINANVSGAIDVSNAIALDTATLTALDTVTATISGTVTVDDGHPDPLTDSELRATPVTVDDGHPDGLTNVELRSSPVDVDIGQNVQDDALTDTELRATPVPIQTDGLTDAELRIAPVVVDDGHPDPQTDGLTDTELRSTPLDVNTGISQPVEEGGNLNVQNLPDDYPDITSQQHLDNRYGGGKTAWSSTISTSGDNTIITPAAGKKLKIYWVYAVTIPTSSSPPIITVKWSGGSSLYTAFAVSHWEVFEGGVDESLVINLSNSDTVAATVHYEEIE